MSRSKQGSRLSETFVNGSAVALLAFLFLLNLTQVARLVTNWLEISSGKIFSVHP